VHLLQKYAADTQRRASFGEHMNLSVENQISHW